MPTSVQAHAGVYSLEATAQVAQVLSSPTEDRLEKSYFDDLTPELQNVLRAQLRAAGDVSAVIEMPGGFALYLAKEKSPTELAVATFSLRKRSYEEWLAVQPD